MICNSIQTLLNYSVKNKLITEDDVIVARNAIMDALNLAEWDENATASDIKNLVEHIKKEVKEKFDVSLECEIEFVE